MPDYGDDNAEEAYMELTSLGSAGLRNWFIMLDYGDDNAEGAYMELNGLGALD
eukprot:gene25831-11507_t